MLLFIEEWPTAGKQVVLRPGFTIGRAECDVLIADPDVSRQHAVVHQVDDELAIEDSSSKNGTFVNDQRVRGITVLKPGDKLRFGNTIWRAELRDNEPDRDGTVLRSTSPEPAS